VQGDHHEISRGSFSCDEGKELRCRNCTHSGIFGLDTALNKAKGGSASPEDDGTENRRSRNPGGKAAVILATR
jgi:hypothetical protein